MEANSLASLILAKAVFNSERAYLIAPKPVILASVLAILASIRSFRGIFSASTRPWASALTSMPEPAPRVLTMLLVAMMGVV